MALILVIDDDPFIRKFFTEILQTAGHDVICAENGQQGLDFYRRQPTTIDLVITDMIMPIKDGLKMLMELLKEFPEAKTIAVSGGGSIEAERYLNLADTIGVQGSLTKPVSQADLLSSVAKTLS